MPQALLRDRSSVAPSPPCISNHFAPPSAGALHFATYESCRRLILDKDDAPGAASTAQQPAAGGATAGERRTANVVAAVVAAFVVALIESPVELFRHNQQVSCRGGPSGSRYSSLDP